MFKIGSILISDLKNNLGIDEQTLENEENMISFDISSSEDTREVAVLDISDEGESYVIEFSRDIIHNQRRNQNVVEFRGVLEKGDSVMDIFIDDDSGQPDARDLLRQFSEGVMAVVPA